MEKETKSNQTSKQQDTSASASSLLHTLAPIFVILAAIFWGILVVFVRAFGKADFASMEIVTLRVYSSAVFAWIFLLIFDRNNQRKRGTKSPQNSNSPQTTPHPTFRLRDSWCFIGTGLVSIVFFSYCYFRNVEVSSAAVAAILMYTSPIFVTLLSAIFFKEKLTKIKLLALILAILGCALVSGIAGGLVPGPSIGIAGGITGGITPATTAMVSVSPLGIALGLGSGIGYALYSIFGRFALNKGYSPFFVTAMTFTFACVGVLPFINITALATKLINEPKYILLALVMGLVGSCTPFALYTLGLRYMEASKAAILATLEPIVTALVGTFFYKEPIDLFIILGIVMVLVAGILCSGPSKKEVNHLWQKKFKLETTSFSLHMMAMIFMLCDHLWGTIIPGNDWLTCIGRLTFPIYAFLIVEGYFHTKSLKKYIGRLLIFAILSEIPFNLAMGSSLFFPIHQNVLWSFLISIGLIHWNEKVKERKVWKRILVGIITLCIASIVGIITFVDYYNAGILMVLVFYFFKDKKWWCYLGQLVCMWYINFEMLGGLSYEVNLFGQTNFIARQGFALLALIPIWLYRGKQGYHSKPLQYAYYAFYPVHLLILGLIKFL